MNLAEVPDADIHECILRYLPNVGMRAIGRALIRLGTHPEVIDEKFDDWTLLAYVVAHGTDNDPNDPLRDDYDLVRHLLLSGARIGQYNIRNYPLLYNLSNNSRWKNVNRLWNLLLAYGEQRYHHGYWSPIPTYGTVVMDVSRAITYNREKGLSFIEDMLNNGKSRILLRVFLTEDNAYFFAVEKFIFSPQFRVISDCLDTKYIKRSNIANFTKLRKVRIRFLR